MINEAVALDLSKKVRSQAHQAMKAGNYIGARPPYGYKKDPENCHKLLVNEDTAPVVRQMFEWAADGVALNVIVKRLNEAGIITPGHYLAKAGLLSSGQPVGSGKWQTWTVNKILSNQVYLGDMVQGKSTSVRRKQAPTKPEDWIVVRGTHEPIISRALFEQAQAMRQKAAEKYTQTEKKPYTENLLRGRVFCGCCGKNLHRQRSHEQYYIYHCISNDRIGKGACDANVLLRETDLFDTILTIIRQQAEAVMGNSLRLKQKSCALSEKKAEIDRETAALRQETEKNRTYLTSLYESFITGILTRTEYTEMKADYERRIAAAVERVQQLETRQAELNRQTADYFTLADRLAAVGADTSLSALLVEQLIERVTVNSKEDISVEFRFENGFDRVAEVLADA